MTLPFSILDRTTIDALGWTLVHFLWQGALLAAVLGALDVILAQSRATFRYLVACLAFATMLIAPIATFSILKGDWGSSHRAPSVAKVATEFDVQGSFARAGFAKVSSVGTRLATPRAVTGFASARRLLPWVVELWMVGVVLLSLRLLGGWWLVRRLARSSANVAIEAWQSRLSDVARRIGAHPPARLPRQSAPERGRDAALLPPCGVVGVEAHPRGARAVL